MPTAPPSKDWREEIPDGEAERFERYGAFFGALQRKNDARGGKGRALHRKQLLGAEATFTVPADVPGEARAGLFAMPGSYQAYVRFSNGGPAVLSDLKPDVRGVAVKVVGVSGKKLIPGLEDKLTQDFLFIHLSSLAFHDADEFFAFVRAASNPLLALPRLFSAVGVGRTFSVLGQLGKVLKPAPESLAGRTFHSGAPIRMGDYAAKLSLRPKGAGTQPPATGRDRLGADLAARLSREPLRYDVAVQLYRDPTSTPIEDAAVEWSDAVAPPVVVAELTIPVQDVASPRGVKIAKRIAEMSFDPWHALVEHRPLGNIMRARNVAYRVSTMARAAAPEPDGTERFD